MINLVPVLEGEERHIGMKDKWMKGRREEIGMRDNRQVERKTGRKM